MNLIVDSSVVMKWFVDEDGSPDALDLRFNHQLAAPDLLLIECRNAFLNKVRRRVISADDANRAESAFEVAGVEILPSVQFLSEAFQIALEIGDPIYDCVYLASAIATQRVLVTADERFKNKSLRSPVGKDHVTLLGALAARR